MTQSFTTGVLVGSLRKASLTRKTAQALIALAPPILDCRIVEIGELPLYNEDLEASSPPAWVAFREAIRPLDALLIATPEYNRSIPGVLKNALDVGSRPYGQNVFDGKPGAVISVTPGAMGGFGANHAVRQSLVFLNVLTLQQPEAYLGHADSSFDEAGAITNESTRQFLARFVDAFAAWVTLIAGARRAATLPMQRSA